MKLSGQNALIVPCIFQILTNMSVVGPLFSEPHHENNFQVTESDEEFYFLSGGINIPENSPA